MLILIRILNNCIVGYSLLYQCCSVKRAAEHILEFVTKQKLNCPLFYNQMFYSGLVHCFDTFMQTSNDLTALLMQTPRRDTPSLLLTALLVGGVIIGSSWKIYDTLILISGSRASAAASPRIRSCLNFLSQSLWVILKSLLVGVLLCYLYLCNIIMQ